MWKELSIGLLAAAIFIISAAYGRMTVANSCNKVGMFAYSDHVFKCTEIKP